MHANQRLAYPGSRTPARTRALAFRPGRCQAAGLAALGFLLLSAPAWAHSLSETVQFSWPSPTSPAQLTWLTSLQLDLAETFSLTGTYVTDPQGGELLAAYANPNGAVVRVSGGFFTEEWTTRLGGGHERILSWDGGEWGVTAEAGRSQFYFDDSLGLSRSQGSLVQWQEAVSTAVRWGYGWEARAGLSLYQYNIKLSQDLIARYGHLLLTRRNLDPLLGAFLLFQVSAGIGYEWEWLGYTGLSLEYGLTWDYSRIYTGLVEWNKEIFEPVFLAFAFQITSAGDKLSSLAVGVNF